MARTITYEVPCFDKKKPKSKVTFETRTGQVILLYVGNYQHRFAIQDHMRQKSLVHVETGLIVGDINDAGIRKMCSMGGGAPPDREAAKYLIDLLVAQHGADKFNATLKEKASEVEKYRALHFA